MQKQKFWAKPDKIVRADIDGTEAPIDPFKSHRVLNSSSTSKLIYNMPTNPTLMNKETYKGPTKKGKSTHKWSMLEAFHRGNPKMRFVTKSPQMLTMDSKPLYSSFSKTGFINVRTDVKIEGPAKLDFKKLFRKMHCRMKKHKQIVDNEMLQKSLKLQEQTGKVMFRTT